MTILSVLWLPVFIIPMVVHHLPSSASRGLDLADSLIWVAFIIEYVARLVLVPDRRRFFVTHLLDLALILVPFFRPLRALRLVRALRFGRVLMVLVNLLRRVQDVLTHRGLHLVLLSGAGIVAVASAVEVMFESGAPGATITSYGQALWWAVVTVTTVGYGDVHPVTAGGEFVAVILMITGIGLLGVLTATVASFFVEQEADRDNAELVQRMERIEKLLVQALANNAHGDEIADVEQAMPAQATEPSAAALKG